MTGFYIMCGALGLFSGIAAVIIRHAAHKRRTKRNLRRGH